MKPRRAVAVVVDASIAGSCGREGATHPHAAACLDTLKMVREGTTLEVAMSPALQREWEEHSSRYARKWLLNMRSSRRVRDVKAPLHSATRRAVRALRNDGVRQAIEKDMHLVEAAFDADERVVSLDEAVRGYLGLLVGKVADLRKLQWANPLASGCLEWLKAHAPEDARWRLAPPASPPTTSR